MTGDMVSPGVWCGSSRQDKKPGKVLSFFFHCRTAATSAAAAVAISILTQSVSVVKMGERERESISGEHEIEMKPW